MGRPWAQGDERVCDDQIGMGLVGSVNTAKDFEGEAARFLEAWTRSIVERDVEAARALRTADYRCILPDGRVITATEDLAMIVASQIDIRQLRTELGSAYANGGSASIRFVLSIGLEDRGRDALNGDMKLERQGGVLRASALALTNTYNDTRPAVGGRIKRLLHRLTRRRRAARPPGFQEMAYRPYQSGLDYRLPRSQPREPVYEEVDLPLPPPELWLGYNYPRHGRLHVDTMWQVLESGGFVIKSDDRILDLGCGAGRMIRHLAPLARTCEIWGADISSEHILWCQRHLTPTFHFLTNTKTPHLPFADASFRLIYCGSLFTHIDDMARAWLLELRRLLADDGCAYITIHDEDTIQQFDAMEAPPTVAAHIMRTPSWAQSKDDSDMFTIGRDENSQVFYARDWFARLLEPMFEIVAIRPGAYFYQTAILVRPRCPQGATATPRAGQSGGAA